jgi:hypothetical protein
MSCATTNFQWRTSGAGEVRHHHRRPIRRWWWRRTTPHQLLPGGIGETAPPCPPIFAMPARKRNQNRAVDPPEEDRE